MISPIKIGSRQSPLAKIQVQEILSQIDLPGGHELIFLKTKGDIDKKTSLSASPGDDFFTNTLDAALLEKMIDISIHSAKDLPKTMTEGLEVYALTKPLDETDSWVSRYELHELPLGAKIGTSSPLRSQMILETAPQAVLSDIRGTIEERLKMLDSGIVDGLIIATCALKRLGLETRIKSILPWQAAALQGQLAVVGRANEEELKSIFHSIDVRRLYGHVTLVGAGPGDPDYITLKAIKALQEADCVIYDYLTDPSLLNYAPRAEHIYAGKRKGNHSIPQKEICRLLKEKACAGKNTVRLKGGDPLIFGRGADEIEYLRAFHIPVEVIPGVSSATGIPSSLSIPLTARGISTSVAFLSAHTEDEVGSSQETISIPRADTLVFLMGLTKLKLIVQSLLQAGWDKDRPIMVISNGTKSTQRAVKGTLSTIEELVSAANLSAPALIMAGATIDLYKASKKPVLLHCGTHPEHYSRMGQIIPWPTIDIKTSILNHEQLQALLKDIETSDLIILTSPNAVKHFLKTILPYAQPDMLRQKIFVAIGQATAQRLACAKIHASIVSQEETAQGLFKLLRSILKLKDKRILLPRSSMPNPFLKESLISEGALVNEWTIYQNTPIDPGPLPTIHIDGVIFTSPSTFNNFIKNYGTIPASWKIYAKGPVTENAINAAGYRPDKVGI